MAINTNKMKAGFLISGFVVFLFSGCGNKEKTNEATGTFQATETIISSEAAGKILSLNVDEGQELKPGQALGYIDSTQVYLATKQLEQNIKALLRGRPNIQVQLEALKQELSLAEADEKRIENLVKAEAASSKMLDDAQTRVAVIKSKIDAMQSSLGTNTGTIDEQAEAMQLQLSSLKDQLKKCRIVNPVKGRVLETYARVYEMTLPGKPLYKIADLDQMVLKVYVTADQFSLLKLGKSVKVRIDSTEDKYREYPATVNWLSDKAEFTPKTIQTKNERANLVYAVKIQVKNDGLLKIGMYGEAILD